jgi:hypothetical protein
MYVLYVAALFRVNQLAEMEQVIGQQRVVPSIEQSGHARSRTDGGPGFTLLDAQVTVQD